MGVWHLAGETASRPWVVGLLALGLVLPLGVRAGEVRVAEERTRAAVDDARVAAERALAAGDVVRARALAEHPTLAGWPERELLIARIELAAGEIELAERRLSRFLALRPDHVEARLWRARSRLATHRLDAAVADYREVMRRRPGPDLALEAAAAAAEQGPVGVDRAIRLLELARSELGPVPALLGRLRELGGVGAVPVPEARELARTALAAPVETGPAERRAQREPARLVRGPYLQQLGPESVIVRWRTDSPVEGRVSFGALPDELRPSARGERVREHAIRLGGLAPDTRYFYRAEALLAEEPEVHSFRTLPRTGARSNVQLFATGAGIASAARPKLAALAAELADAWLVAGDLGPGPAPADSDFFTAAGAALRRVPFFPVLSQRDAWRSDATTQSGDWFESTSLSHVAGVGGVPSGTEAYYAFDVANIHVIALDSREAPRDRRGAMLRWLEADLAAQQQDWVVAFWYDAALGSAVTREGREMRQGALAVLEEGGVDLVLMGAGPLAARSALLGRAGGFDRSEALRAARGDGCPCGEVCSVCALGGDGAYQKPEGRSPGAVHVVLGRVERDAAPGDPDALLAFPLPEPGGLLIDVEGLALTGLWLDGQGRVWDRFVIEKIPRDAERVSATEGVEGPDYSRAYGPRSSAR